MLCYTLKSPGFETLVISRILWNPRGENKHWDWRWKVCKESNAHLCSEGQALRTRTSAAAEHQCFVPKFCGYCTFVHRGNRKSTLKIKTKNHIFDTQMMINPVRNGFFEHKSAFFRACFKHLKLWVSSWCQPLTQAVNTSALPSCKQALTAEGDGHWLSAENLCLCGLLCTRCLWCLLHASENRPACSAQVKSLPCSMAFSLLLFIFGLTLYICNEMAILLFLFLFFPLYLVHLLASEGVLLCGWHCWTQAIKPSWRHCVWGVPPDILISSSQSWRRHREGKRRRRLWAGEVLA